MYYNKHRNQIEEALSNAVNEAIAKGADNPQADPIQTMIGVLQNQRRKVKTDQNTRESVPSTENVIEKAPSAVIEEVLSEAVNEAMKLSDPMAAIGVMVNSLQEAQRNRPLDQAIHDTLSTEEEDKMAPDWEMDKWLQRLELHKIIGEVLRGEKSKTPRGPKFVEKLAELEEQQIVQLLNHGDCMNRLVEEIRNGAETLKQSKSKTGGANHKFIGLVYGHLSTYFKGLEGVLGPPSVSLQEAIEREHCNSSDSVSEFTVPNYGCAAPGTLEGGSATPVRVLICYAIAIDRIPYACASRLPSGPRSALNPLAPEICAPDLSTACLYPASAVP